MLVLGGLYGSQAAGRELAMRLARHLATGHQLADPRVKAILSGVEVIIVPALDREAFQTQKPGKIIIRSITFIKYFRLLWFALLDIWEGRQDWHAIVRVIYLL